MKAPGEYRLYFGPYRQPLVPKDGRLYCEMRGYLSVGAFSHGPIPWPMKKGKHSLILCGDLVRAVKMESVTAIAHHWNVSRALVQVWRKALEVPEFNAGTRKLREYAERASKDFRRARALKRWKDPACRLPRPLPRRELRRAATSQVVRERMARTGRHPNADLRLWTTREERLLGTGPDSLIARKLKRTPQAVRARRNFLGVPSFQHAYGRVWTATEDKLIGTRPDSEVGRLLGRTGRQVMARRLQLRVPYRNREKRKWSAKEDRLLGRYSDVEVGRRTGRSRQAAQLRRLFLGIPLRNPKIKPWTAAELRLVGKQKDRDVARLTGRAENAVRLKRWKMRIAAPGG